MKKNIRIAKNLIKIAKELVAITMTNKSYNDFSNQYENDFGDVPDRSQFDLFKNTKKMRQFLKKKKRTFPNLKEFIPQDKLKRLLAENMMCIVSAGRNDDEIKNPGLITDNQVKQRNEELCHFLESLNLPYYEVIGRYGANQEKSYIVDLTNDGMYNNSDPEVLSNLHKIRNVCLDNCNQSCTIEGLSTQTVFQYKSSYISQDQTNPYNDPYTDKSSGRSTIFTNSPSRYNRRNPSNTDDYTDSFSNNYDWNNPNPGARY